MSTIYEKLLVNLSVSSDSCATNKTALTGPCNPQSTMDKSVFARVLKVVIQCVEEGSALLHTFKMEGDISNTRITIEFHSHIHSTSDSAPSSGGSPGAGDHRKYSQHHRDTSITEKPLQRSQSPYQGSTVSSDSIPASHSERQLQHPDSNDSSTERLQSANQDMVDITENTKAVVHNVAPHTMSCSNCCGECRCGSYTKKGIIPNGSTPTIARDRDSKKHFPEHYHNGKAGSSVNCTGSPVIQPVRKANRKGPKSGAHMDQLIKDQNRIPTLKKHRSQDDLDDEDSQHSGWDTNQNTVQRKNRNPVAKSASVDLIDDVSVTEAPHAKTNSPIPNGSSRSNRGHVPIEANVILANRRYDDHEMPGTRPKMLGPMGGLLGTAGELMSHPSLITRLAKMSERESDEGGYGSSGEDSFDSDESIDMVTDTRQFAGNKRNAKKPIKKSKGVISL